MSFEEHIEAAEKLWQEAEDMRAKAQAAVDHATAMQRMCDAVLRTTLPWKTMQDLYRGPVFKDALSQQPFIIVIFGPPHSGKTALGRMLSEQLLARFPTMEVFLEDETAPVTFTDSGVTIVIRSRDSIFGGQGARCVFFTGPHSPCLQDTYGWHLRALMLSDAPPTRHRRLKLILNDLACPSSSAGARQYLLVMRGESPVIIKAG
jgi:hypothetical protein